MTCDSFEQGMIADFDYIAFGCPAMGAEMLEDTEFEPMFSARETALCGKKIALFGTYGWGDGEWMRTWEERVKDDGAELFCSGLTVNNTPDAAALEECRKLGAMLA